MASPSRPTPDLGKLIRKHRQTIARLEAAQKKRDAALRKAPRLYGFTDVEAFIAAVRRANKTADARGHRLSQKQRERMLAAIKAGATPAVISKRFRIALTTAAYHVGRHAPKKQKS